MPFDRALLPAPATYFEAQNLKLSGPRNAKWKTTSCVFHGGSDSMRVNVQLRCMGLHGLDAVHGGDVLAYEWLSKGIGFMDAAKALGAWLDDGKHLRQNDRRRYMRGTRSTCSTG